MSQNLMKEMLWSKPAATIEMFAIKKHMQFVPHLKNKDITQLSRRDYDSLSKSSWARMLRDQRPDVQREFPPPYRNTIHSQN